MTVMRTRDLKEGTIFLHTREGFHPLWMQCTEKLEEYLIEDTEYIEWVCIGLDGDTYELSLPADKEWKIPSLSDIKAFEYEQ